MKKTEIILGVIAIIALTIQLLNLPGGGILTVLTLSTVSTMYMFLSFALFNDIRLRKIFKKDSYKGISTMRILGAILTGLALSITTIGLLFKFQSWPGASFPLRFGLFGLLIGLIVGLIKYQKTKSDYYTKIFKRIAIYGGLGLILMILPRETWLEIRNRNHPEYMLGLDNEEEIEDVNYEEEEDIYEAPIMTRAEIMPVFPGECQEIANAKEQDKCTQGKIINFVQSNAKYPQIATENGFQGKVFLTFIIDENGKVGNVEILKGIHKSLDDSAIKAVMALPKFTPASQRDKPVKLKYTIPVNFKLR
jgi:TonB family protein